MSNYTAHVPRLLILSITIALASAFSACSRAEPTSTPVLSNPPTTSLPLPPIRTDGDAEMGWTLTDGTRVKLSDHKGKVLVLDLYATWCAACRESIPHLNELHNRYQGEAVQIVGLNVGGPDDRVKVLAFASELKITYPLGFPDKSLGDLLISDDPSIPQTFVFARDGKLLKRYIGYDDPQPAEIEQMIKAELGAN